MSGVPSGSKVPCAGISQREYCIVLTIPGDSLGLWLRSGFGGQRKYADVVEPSQPPSPSEVVIRLVSSGIALR